MDTYPGTCRCAMAALKRGIPPEKLSQKGQRQLARGSFALDWRGRSVEAPVEALSHRKRGGMDGMMALVLL